MLRIYLFIVVTLKKLRNEAHSKLIQNAMDNNNTKQVDYRTREHMFVNF